eukprot:11841985-Prorocentrum_lima.AAC.1
MARKCLRATVSLFAVVPPAVSSPSTPVSSLSFESRLGLSCTDFPWPGSGPSPISSLLLRPRWERP